MAKLLVLMVFVSRLDSTVPFLEIPSSTSMFFSL